jgi:hypothetical protein
MSASGEGSASLYGSQGTSIQCEFVNNNMTGHATERVNHPKADFIAYNINERLYVACRAANGGYADVVAAGEFVERSALRAPSGGLFLLRRRVSALCRLSASRYSPSTRDIFSSLFPSRTIYILRFCGPTMFL